MKNFAPKPKEFYTYGGVVGPGAQKEITDEEWNMHSVTSRALFAYEQGKKPGERKGHFDKSLTVAVKESMALGVNGKSVLGWMKSDSPINFLDACLKDQKAVVRLPICKWYGSLGHFMVVLRARTAAWKQDNKMFLSPDDRAATAAALRGL